MAISKNYTRLATLFAVLNQNPPSDNSGKAKIVNTNYFPTAKAEDVEKLVGGLVVPEEEEEWSAEQERKREKSGVEAGEDGEDPGAKKREVDSGVEAGEDDDLRLDARKANCVWLYVMAKTRI